MAQPPAKPEPLFKIYERIILLTQRQIVLGDGLYGDRPPGLPESAIWPEAGAKPFATVVAILFQPKVTETNNEFDDTGNLIYQRVTETPAEYLVWVEPTTEGRAIEPRTKLPYFESSRCQRIPHTSVENAFEVWDTALAHNEIIIRTTEIIEASAEEVRSQQQWVADRQAAAQAATQAAQAAQAAVQAAAQMPTVPTIAAIPVPATP